VGSCTNGRLSDLRAAAEVAKKGKVAKHVQKAIERAPQQPVTVDVEKQAVRCADRVITARIPDGPRNQLVQGTWDSTAVLLEAGGAIETTAKKLAYVAGY
jgi:3-isopropylmalate dehydratase small subunit